MTLLFKSKTNTQKNFYKSNGILGLKGNKTGIYFWKTILSKY